MRIRALFECCFGITPDAQLRMIAGLESLENTLSKAALSNAIYWPAGIRLRSKQHQLIG